MSTIKSTGEACYDARLALISERDELARQVTALQLSHQNIINALSIKGDGPVSQQVIELVNGLVAENVALKEWSPDPRSASMFEAIERVEQLMDEGMPELAMVEAFEILKLKRTPTTDAAIAELKAQGVDDFIKHCQRQLNTNIYTKSGRAKFEAGITTAAPFAKILRAGGKE